MDFSGAFQLSTLILLEIYSLTVTANEADCNINPTNVDKVDILVYINGGTRVDEIWYARYCSWRDGGFPYDTYAPVTIKVGGEVTCDDNNNCNCSNEDSDQVDCKVTFEHVCAQQILGDEEFENLLCCSAKSLHKDKPGNKGFQRCVKERSGLKGQIAECMKKEGSDSPQAIALQNAKEVVDKGVDMADNTEPFFFYNGLFDKCINDDSPAWFLQKICLMLKFDIAKNISQCVKAMGWKLE